MVCRRCKKEQPEKLGLCLECRERVMEITRALASRDREDSLPENDFEHEVVRLVLHPVYAGYGSIIALSTFFIFVFLTDPNGAILNSLVLAMISLFGFWGLLAGGILLIEVAMFFAVPLPSTSQLTPKGYYAGLMFLKMIPFVFVILGAALGITMLFFSFPSIDWKPLLSLMTGKKI